MKRKSLKILTVTYDMKNLFENDFAEMKRKLNRDRLAPDENKILMFCWSNKSYTRETSGVKTVHLRKRIIKSRVFYDFISIFIVPWQIKKQKFQPDIIWTRDFSLVFSGLIAKWLWGSKIILQLGSTPRTMAKSKKFGFVYYWFQVFYEFFGKNLVDYYFANGPATRDYMVGLGISKEKISILPGNKINLEKDIINKVSAGHVRNKYKISNDKKIMLCVSRLEPEKGVDRVIDAFQKLKIKDLVLLIVGDGAWREKLEKQAENLILEKQIFFTGNVSRQEIWQYYKDADVFILLSLSEGTPTVIREAMYIGAPVIGSRIPGIEGFIGKSEERGYYWEEADGRVKFGRIIEQCLNREPLSVKKIKLAKHFVDQEVLDNRVINEFIK